MEIVDYTRLLSEPEKKFILAAEKVVVRNHRDAPYLVLVYVEAMYIALQALKLKKMEEIGDEEEKDGGNIEILTELQLDLESLETILDNVAPAIGCLRERVKPLENWEETPRGREQPHWNLEDDIASKYWDLIKDGSMKQLNLLFLFLTQITHFVRLLRMTQQECVEKADWTGESPNISTAEMGNIINAVKLFYQGIHQQVMRRVRSYLSTG